MAINERDKARLISIMKVRKAEFTKEQLKFIEDFKKELKPRFNKLRRICDSLTNYHSPLKLEYFLGLTTISSGDMNFRFSLDICDTNCREIFGDFGSTLSNSDRFDCFRDSMSFYLGPEDMEFDLTSKIKQLDEVVATAELLANVIKSQGNCITIIDGGIN